MSSGGPGRSFGVSGPHLVAGGGDGGVGVAAAGLAALPSGQVPVLWGTVVARQACDVGSTLALAGGPLAHAVLTVHTLAGLRAQEVTRAL